MAATQDKDHQQPQQSPVTKQWKKAQVYSVQRRRTLFALIDTARSRNGGIETAPHQAADPFGSPKGGTPVMLAAPSQCLDLPLKILVWEDVREKPGFRTISSTYLQ